MTMKSSGVQQFLAAELKAKEEQLPNCLVIEREILPDELIAEILHRLPVEFLWEVCRYVCKGWREILCKPCFVSSSISSASLLMQQSREPRHQLACLGDSLSCSKFELTNMCFNPAGLVVASFDGVLLISLGAWCYVANPVTKQFVRLPPPPTEHHIIYRRSNITRVSKTGKFKVLGLGKELNNSELFSWFVLTIGTSMSWTKLFNVPQEWCPTAHNAYRLRTISVDGVIYVFNWTWLTFEKQTIRAFDLRHDEPHMHNLKNPPKCRYKRVTSCWPIILGREHLGLVNAGNDQADIWMLKDLYLGKWDMIKSITFSNSPYSYLSSYSCDFSVLLDAGRILVIVFSAVHQGMVECSAMAYCFNTGKWQRVGVGRPYESKPDIFIFTSSLCPLF